MRTKSGQPVELDKGDLAAAADEGVGVHAAPVDVAVVGRDAHVIKQVGDLRHTKEIGEEVAENLSEVTGSLHSSSLRCRRLKENADVFDCLRNRTLGDKHVPHFACRNVRVQMD